MDKHRKTVYFAAMLSLIIVLTGLFVVTGLLLIITSFLIEKVGFYIATSFFVAPFFLGYSMVLYSRVKKELQK